MRFNQASIIIAGGIIVAGSIAITTAWTGPTTTPPMGNVNPPINTGSGAQTKAGDLGVNTFLASGNASVLGNLGVGTSNPGVKLDVLGRIRAYGDSTTNGFALDSTGYFQLQNGDPILGFDGNDYLSYTRSTDSFQFNSGGNTRLAINSSGNVGIGAASPLRRLHLEESGQFAQMLWRAGTGSNKDLIMHYGENTTAGNQFRFGRYTRSDVWEANPIWFDMDAPDSTFVVNGDGRVGIGTANPAQKFDVVGQSHWNGAMFWDDNNPGNGMGQQIYLENWDGTFSINNSNNFNWVSARLSLDSNSNMSVNGDVCAYWGSYCLSWLSDERLKKDIGTYPNEYGLATLMQLNPVSFHWKDINKDTKEGEQLGFIAQDVQKVAPRLIKETTGSQEYFDGVSSTTVQDPKGLNDRMFMVMLVKSVQELKKENDALRAEFEAYKNTHP